MNYILKAKVDDYFMHNLRCYYHATIEEFMRQSEAEIAGVIHLNDIPTQIAGESE